MRVVFKPHHHSSPLRKKDWWWSPQTPTGYPSGRGGPLNPPLSPRGSRFRTFTCILCCTQPMARIQVTPRGYRNGPPSVGVAIEARKAGGQLVDDRVGWSGTPHYRRAGGRLFVSRNSSKEIERVFDFTPETSSCGQAPARDHCRAISRSRWPCKPANSLF